MSELFNQLVSFLQYPFVVYAIITGVLLALCSSLLGVTLVLKRFSYIGDGLSHVAFGAMAIASVLKVTNDLPLILVITCICAVVILQGGRGKIKGDATIAMLSVGALAVGYLLINVFSTSANLAGDVCTTLFGSTSIITLTKSDVVLCLVLSVVVIAMFVLLYNKLFAVTFDESFAQAGGMNVTLFNLVIALITAIVIVMAMNLVGSLLVTALIIFPAVSAMRMYNSFLSVTICAVVMSVICALVGLVTSILASTPVGATIVAVYIVCFAVSSLVGKLKKRAA